MKAALRMLSISAAVPLAVLLSLGLSPAAHAAAAHAVPQYSSNYPKDCSFITGNNADSLTCTNRPAQQRWQLVTECIPWKGIYYYYGNVVTGDGTSSTRSCPGLLLGVNFEVVKL